MPGCKVHVCCYYIIAYLYRKATSVELGDCSALHRLYKPSRGNHGWRFTARKQVVFINLYKFCHDLRRCDLATFRYFSNVGDLRICSCIFFKKYSLRFSTFFLHNFNLLLGLFAGNALKCSSYGWCKRHVNCFQIIVYLYWKAMSVESGICLAWTISTTRRAEIMVGGSPRACRFCPARILVHGDEILISWKIYEICEIGQLIKFA